MKSNIFGYNPKFEMNNDDLDFVLKYKIKPLLEEYFYGDEDGLESVMQIVKHDGDDDTE